MIIDIKVPSPGESISQVVLSTWLVANGSKVDKDQEIAEIDSDKATLPLYATESGIISFKAEEGDTIAVGDVACTINTEGIVVEKGDNVSENKTLITEIVPEKVKEEKAVEEKSDLHISPLARKMLDSEGLTESQFVDILKTMRFGREEVAEALHMAKEAKKHSPKQKHEEVQESKSAPLRETETKKMSPLRVKLAQRLVAVKNQTAMLTTFNEVNMHQVIELRKENKDRFKEKYGVGLGYMSFFTKAAAIALQEFPAINSMIDGEDMVFHKYIDISVAVSTPKGLMAPVVRNVENLNIPQIEIEIAQLASKAREGKISLDEMSGGTFTITNGGVFGSLMSTPIINPPQSAILGMHNIVERPIAENGQVVIRPMMYIALSYDHRVVDGRESVSFLVRIKELLENPEKLLIEGKDFGKALLEL